MPKEKEPPHQNERPITRMECGWVYRTFMRRSLLEAAKIQAHTLLTEGLPSTFLHREGEHPLESLERRVLPLICRLTFIGLSAFPAPVLFHLWQDGHAHQFDAAIV